MENLYELDDYPGELPNPKRFPLRGATIIAIKGKPYAFCDGFMLDLLVREADRKVLEEKVLRTVDISNQLEDGRGSKLLLSEPEFIYDSSYPTYIMFAPEGNPIGIQVKYYRYFRNRYKECKFYKRDKNPLSIVTIKVGEEVVGLCMPIFLDVVTEIKAKEERNGT